MSSSHQFAVVSDNSHHARRLTASLASSGLRAAVTPMPMQGIMTYASAAMSQTVLITVTFAQYFVTIAIANAASKCLHVCVRAIFTTSIALSAIERVNDIAASAMTFAFRCARGVKRAASTLMTEFAITRVADMEEDIHFPPHPPLTEHRHRTADYAVDESVKCCVCIDRPPTFACVPCGHRSLCNVCSDRLNSLLGAYNRRCPICRTRFTATIRIYL